MRIASCGLRILERDRNVVRVDFHRDPEPPQPRFPGSCALRGAAIQGHVEAVASAIGPRAA